MDQSITKQLLGVPYLFNLLAILLNLVPFLVVCIAPKIQDVKRYFAVRAFIIGSFLNYLLACHILFVIKEKEQKDHVDTLVVALIGMTLGITSTFIWLMHGVLVDKSTSDRVWMLLVIIWLVCGSSVLLHGIQVEFRASEHKWGWIIRMLVIITASILNGLPIIIATIRDTRLEPDLKVDTFGLLMSLINTIDACYFVVYTYYTGTFGSLLSAVSFITAVCGVHQLLVFSCNMFQGLVGVIRHSVFWLLGCLLFFGLFWGGSSNCTMSDTSSEVQTYS